VLAVWVLGGECVLNGSKIHDRAERIHYQKKAMARYVFLFMLVISLLFIQCQKNEPIDLSSALSIQVNNHLNTTVDTFKFHFDTTTGGDSLLITDLQPGQISDKIFFEDVIYRFFETGDYFLIKKGRFKIGDKEYYVSHCFCDPGLFLDTLKSGDLLIDVEEIDLLRGQVKYKVVLD
jgi:hypothetical protein